MALKVKKKARISKQYDPFNPEDFPEFQNKQFTHPTIEPEKVYKVIESMNKKAATVGGDNKLIGTPLAHLYNVCLIEGIYPDILKHESVTPRVL